MVTKILVMGSLFGVALLCMSIGLAADSIGTSVPDSVATELKGGGCNNKFHYPAANPTWCQGGTGCNGQQIPDETVGEGNSGSQESNCGGSGAQTCARVFYIPDDCAT